MKTIKEFRWKLFFLLSIVFIGSGCEKEEAINDPNVTLEVADITKNKVKFVMKSNAKYNVLFNGYSKTGQDVIPGDTLVIIYPSSGKYTAVAIGTNIGNYAETVKRSRVEVEITIE